jgi:site-specific recombinase XerD
MDFPIALRAFDAAMVVAGLAEVTRRKYRYELTRFWCDWCAVDGLDLFTATRTDLNAYVVSLPAHGSKRGDATRALKAFYRWLAGEHRLDDPSEPIRIPKPKLGEAPTLSTADEVRLLSAAFRKEPRRGWAITLCLYTGARVASLAAVRPQDVDLELKRITFVVAKGDKPYSVPMGKPAVVAARYLIDEARLYGRPTLLGVGAARFRQWVHEAEQSAGLDRIWPHLLRHEYSNRVAAHGDPEAWRRLMNHSDLSQWARYVHAPDERLRAAVPGA